MNNAHGLENRVRVDFLDEAVLFVERVREGLTLSFQLVDFVVALLLVQATRAFKLIL
jgi:hypothetical protein